MPNGMEHTTTMLLKRSYLPVCASCSKVRNGDGVWSRSTLVFGRPADVLLTHGACPDCVQDIYRQLDRGRR